MDRRRICPRSPRPVRVIVMKVVAVSWSMALDRTRRNHMLSAHPRKRMGAREVRMKTGCDPQDGTGLFRDVAKPDKSRALKAARERRSTETIPTIRLTSGSIIERLSAREFAIPERNSA